MADLVFDKVPLVREAKNGFSQNGEGVKTSSPSSTTTTKEGISPAATLVKFSSTSSSNGSSSNDNSNFNNSDIAGARVGEKGVEKKSGGDWKLLAGHGDEDRSSNDNNSNNADDSSSNNNNVISIDGNGNSNENANFPLSSKEVDRSSSSTNNNNNNVANYYPAVSSPLGGSSNSTLGVISSDDEADNDDDAETQSIGAISSAASTAMLLHEDALSRSAVNAAREAEWIATYEDNKRVMASFVDKGIVSGADYYEFVADSRLDEVFVVSVTSGRNYSYREVDMHANAIAHWAHGLGWRQGDAVALAMENCPRFLQTWIGLAKIGVTVACINTNITGEALAHAIQVARCRAALVSLQQIPKWDESCEHAAITVPVYSCDGARFDEWHHPQKQQQQQQQDQRQHPKPKHIHSYAGHLEDELLLQQETSSSSSSFLVGSSIRPDRALRSDIKGTDALFYIYTSGTTGFSKAALFSHTRFIGAGVTWSRAMHLTNRDVFYVTLPLYHGNGGCVAVSAVLRSGSRLVIREKFSVSNFLPDVRRFGCTATIYIGEMWRYIHNSPGGPNDADNPLRVACGNGLRGDIWRAICDRFGISLIVEHYGQTEMPSAHPMINHYNVVGSCGYIPPSVRGGLGTECLIKFDIDAGKPVRNADGWCIRCAPSEAGEAIARLNSPYAGYTSNEAAQRAVYRDVFEKGDMWYHSGDLLACDEDGFFYFVDRVGDTFRWKGENVATGEVCEAIGTFPAVAEANVYGVAVPGTEGRAGMASLVLHHPPPPVFSACAAAAAAAAAATESDSEEEEKVATAEDDVPSPRMFSESIDMSALYIHLSERLPAYARPLFLRVRCAGEENEKTSTFKFRKTTYQQQGFNPAACAPDLVFFRDDDQATFVPLCPSLLSRILGGKVKI